MVIGIIVPILIFLFMCTMLTPHNSRVIIPMLIGYFFDLHSNILVLVGLMTVANSAPVSEWGLNANFAAFTHIQRPHWRWAFSITPPCGSICSYFIIQIPMTLRIDTRGSTEGLILISPHNYPLHAQREGGLDKDLCWHN